MEGALHGAEGPAVQGADSICSAAGLARSNDLRETGRLAGAGGVKRVSIEIVRGGHKSACQHRRKV